MRLFFLLATTIWLTGCFKDDIACDSSAVNKIITNDIKYNLTHMLRERSVYFSDVKLNNIKTLKSDDTLEARLCVGNIFLDTKIDNYDRNRTIKYYTQRSNEEKKPVIIRFLNKTKTKIIHYANQTTLVHHNKVLAKKNGFSEYKDYKQYKNTKNILSGMPDKLARISGRISEQEKKVVQLENLVKSTLTAINNKEKTLLVLNQYISMKPIILDQKDIEISGFPFRNLKFSATVKTYLIQRLMSFTLMVMFI